MAEADNEKPKTLQVNLTPAARRVIEAIREETGVPNTTAMERLLEWFAEQDLELRLALLNRNSKSRQVLLRPVIQQMAGLDKVGMNKPPDQIADTDAAAAMHTLVDRLLAISQQRGKALYDVAVKPKETAEKGQGGKGK